MTRHFAKVFSLPTLTLVWLAVFVFVSIVGIAHPAGMEANEKGEMSGCIFAGEAAMCNMNVIEHISSWQGMMTGIVQDIPAAALVLSIVLIAAFTAPAARMLLVDHVKRIVLQRLSFLFNTLGAVFNPLQRAFARGILHPRIYEIATR